MSKPRKITLSSGKVAWEVYVREAGRGSNELRRRFPSSREAQDFLEDWKVEQRKTRQGGPRVGSFHTTTFRVESENWLDNLKLRVSPGHYLRAKEVIKNVNELYGDLEPNKINADFLTALQHKLKSRRKKGVKSDWSNCSVNRYTECITAALNFAVSQRRIPYNPAVGFKKLPKNSNEMLFWEENEARSFLTWASGHHSEWSNQHRAEGRKTYIAYLLALNTGMRAGEIWGLKPRDLVFRDDGGGDTIFVRRQFLYADRKFGPLKGTLKANRDKSRHVPCSPGLRKELETLIKFNKTGPDQTIFHSVFGNPIHHKSFRDRFMRDLKRWGGRKIRFHDLRHTAATLMLSQGVDVKTVSDILGHEDIKTTMIYVHLLGDRIKQVSKMFSIRPVDLVEDPTSPQP